ncbi:MAG: universal stress protein [Burkholderiales bacterium]|nr:universal stress protein [Burkholderiales bacterium]
MRIVVPTDGSQASLAAINELLPLFVWFARPVTLALVHVHEKIPYSRAVAWIGKDAAQKYYDEESDAALAPGAAVLETAGVTFEKVRRVGDPAQEIVAFASEWKGDLIAIGRHGHTALQKLLLGSVAQKVVAASTIPVLLLA